MKVFLAVTLLVSSAIAQSASSGHVFYAPTAIKNVRTTNLGHTLGGGYDYVFWRGIGIAGDVGWLWSGDRIGSGLGVGSLNGSYHFPTRQKLDPFVTAGYGLLFRSGTVNMANFGGGANWWFHDSLGLRLEVRDHSDFGSRSQHFISFRLGLSFR
jgi:hypothetical protein